MGGLPLELCRRQLISGTVFALPVVKKLNVVEHILSGFVSCQVNFPTYPLPFQQLEEAFSDGIDAPMSTTASRDC